MTKHIRPAIFMALSLFTSSLLAQDAAKETPAPSTEQAAAAPSKASCHDYCKNMMVAPKKGFHHSIEWGGIYGGPRNQVTYRMFGHTFNQDMRDRDAVRMSAGYQFNPYIFLGGGVGADISSVNVYNVPVFADFRAYFTKTRVAPFFEAAFGYNLQINATPGNNYYYYSQPATVNVYHGMMANPSFGVRVAINKKFATSLTLGYKLLGVNQTVTDYYYGGTSSQFVLSHGITVKAGFHF